MENRIMSQSNCVCLWGPRRWSAPWFLEEQVDHVKKSDHLGILQSPDGYAGDGLHHRGLCRGPIEWGGNLLWGDWSAPSMHYWQKADIGIYLLYEIYKLEFRKKWNLEAWTWNQLLRNCIPDWIRAYNWNWRKSRPLESKNLCSGNWELCLYCPFCGKW